MLPECIGRGLILGPEKVDLNVSFRTIVVVTGSGIFPQQLADIGNKS